MRRFIGFVPYLLACGGAAAQDDFSIGEIPKPKDPPRVFASEVVAGAGYQSLDSFYFGRYGGVVDEGPFGFIAGSLNGRPLWDSGAIRYWEADVLLKGPDRYAVSAAIGDQGSWRMAAFHDAFTRFVTESARTPFDGAGTTRLVLPTNWNSTASSLAFNQLLPNLKPLELKTDWRTTGSTFVLAPKNGYELRIRMEHREREGLKPHSLSFGPEANFPVGVFFPLPIDFTTNRLTAALAFVGQRSSWEVSYGLHEFHDDDTSVLVQNPFARSLGLPWPGGAFAGFPFANAQYSTPPNSVAHRFALTGTYAVTPRTRLTARLSHTIQKQNEPFLPYSPTAQLVVRTPVPRASLDGKVRKTFANIGISSRDIDNADFTASYTFDRRRNLSPIDLYNYIPGDSQDQATPAVAGVSRYIRYNLPHSFDFQKVRAEAGYRPTARTRLSLAYTGDFKERDFQQVLHSNEHTVTAKALTTFERASGWISASYVRRGGSDYEDAVAWDASHTTNYLNAGPQNQSIEYPLLFKYYLADRKRTEVKGGLTFDVTEQVAFSASAGRARDDYYKSLFGLRKSRSLIASADVSYALSNIVTATAFYSYERYSYDQKGYYIFNTNLTNPSQEWTARNRDAVNSAGARVEWHAMPDKLKVTTLYTLSDGSTDIDVAATAFTPLATVAPLPDVIAKTHHVGLEGEYRFKPDWSVIVGWVYEDHVTRDWAYDNVAIAPVAQILGSGIVSPHYSAHVLTLATKVAF